MYRHLRKGFTWYNEQREKRGLPPVSRRYFMKMVAMSSAGLSVPWIYSCGSDDPAGAQAGSGGGYAGYGGGWAGSGGGYAGYGGAPQAGYGGAQAGIGGAQAGTGGEQPAGTGGAQAGTGGQPAGTGGAQAGTGGAPPDAGPPDGSAGDSGPPDTSTKIAVSRDVNVLNNTRNAIDMAGGLSGVVGGDRVVIKPNLMTAGTDCFTNVEVLRGIIQALKTHTSAANITLAECTAVGMDTTLWAEMAGYTALCQQEGINFAAWDLLPYVGYQDPNWQFITEEKRVPQMLDPAAPQYDHFITASKLKNHQVCPYSSVVFTSCIKLFVGVIPFQAPGGRWTPEPDGIHDEFLGEQCAELHCIVPRKLMNVIDSTTCCVANGPAGAGLSDIYFPNSDANGPMIVAPAGLVVASTDMVACDSMGLAILKHYARQLNAAGNPGVDRYLNRSVWADAQIARAGQLGFGTTDPTQIAILDSNVDNIDAIKAEWV